MTIELENLVRSGAPRVTQDAARMDALMAVSDEAASAALRSTKKRRRITFSAVVAGALVIGGANVAAAATHSLWWTAPGEVVAEAIPVSGDSAPVKTVSFILSAGYADGVNGGSTDARAVFQKAQQWLAEHPVTVDVPADAPTAPAGTSDVPTSVAADQAAITATRESLSVKVADQKTAIALALGEYLTSQGFDAQTIVIDSTQGVYRVGR